MKISNIKYLGVSNGYSFTYGEFNLLVEIEYINQTMMHLYSDERFTAEEQIGLTSFRTVSISLEEYAMDIFESFGVDQKSFVLESLIERYKEVGHITKIEWIEEMERWHSEYYANLKAKSISNQILSTISQILK